MVHRHPEFHAPEPPKYIEASPNPQNPEKWGRRSAMEAMDAGFLAATQANPHLRPRVGNPDEMKSNRMLKTLEALKFRVTDPEPGIPEDIHGAVVTALNEEAVAGAALGNKAGINIAVTYEAFGMKMHGIFRQEVTWIAQSVRAGEPPGWISIALVLTSHTWENAKNEHSIRIRRSRKRCWASTRTFPGSCLRPITTVQPQSCKSSTGLAGRSGRW